MSDSGIYVIKNIENGKPYIGRSNDCSYRLRKHKEALRDDRHDNEHLQRAFNKYGEDSFIFEQVQEWDENELISREQDFLDVLFDNYNFQNFYNDSDDASEAPPVNSGEDHYAYKGKYELTCEYCGDSFKVQHYRKDTASYCGFSCRSSDQTGHGTVLKKENVVIIKNILEKNLLSCYRLAQLFNISETTLYRIRDEDTWSYINTTI